MKLGFGFWVLGFGIFVSACAARSVVLPTDPGAPLPDYSQIHAELTRSCLGVRTMTAELGLSGRVGSQNLRGRVVAGFARPDSMRLEGVAPFGAPVFILVSRGATATLVLPRDGRVVRSPRGEEILGALTGVALSAGDLQAIFTGCVTADPRAAGGRLHQNGWASIDLDGGATLFLQRVQNAWLLRAARRGDWQIEYAAWQGTFPQTVRLRSTPASVDVTAAISQLETNIDLDAAAFTLGVPVDAREMTVEELRQAGPLRGQ